LYLQKRLITIASTIVGVLLELNTYVGLTALSPLRTLLLPASP
jgi:hypothetical protein